MDTSKTRPYRKPYDKPVVQEVRLRISEAVLGTVCRLSFSGAYVQGDHPDCVLTEPSCLQA